MNKLQQLCAFQLVLVGAASLARSFEVPQLAALCVLGLIINLLAIIRTARSGR